jgi:uncharacterized membrane protein YjjP (DUF1212 family)
VTPADALPPDEESAPPSLGRTREELADYLLEIGATLAAYGCPSYRLEDVIREVAAIEGHRAEPFALPTGLFLRVTPKGSSLGDVQSRAPEVHRMKRLWAGAIDLGRLTEVDRIFNEVAARRLEIHRARVAIREVVSRPPRYGALAMWCASVVLSATAAVSFRGLFVDVAASAVAGGVVGATGLALSRRASARLLFDFLAAFLVTLVAWSALRVAPWASPEVIVLSGAISLFPGMVLTTGVAEITQKNLVSGGARMMEALVTLLLLSFGVALAAGLGDLAHVKLPPSTERVGLGLPAQLVALFAASTSFAVLFQVPRRDYWTAVASGAMGWIVSTTTARHLPNHISAFLSAFAVSMLANLLARRTSRPAQLFQLPGMMLLVPGSFGFLSFSDFLRGDVVHGVARAFSMMLVGVGLVIGLLLANALLPARKLL